MQRINFAVKGFVLHEDKFLLMHKREEKENLWELPGGRMEFGETAEETLIREKMRKRDCRLSRSEF